MQIRLIVMIALFSAIITLTDLVGFLAWYKNLRSIILYPIQVTTHSLVTGISNISRATLNADSMLQENALLKQKVLALEDSVEALQSQQALAEAIKLYPELFSKQSYKKTEKAQILDTSYNNVYGRLLLNKGSNAGVTQGAPVVIGALYVGTITEVFPFSSVCTTIFVPGQQLLATIPKRKITATAKSSLTDVRLIDLLASEQIQQDDSVYIFRDGYPYMMLLGAISQPPENTGSAERSAKILPGLTLDTALLVNIVLE